MEINKKIAVHAYKFDGWLYRTWEFPTVIKETDEYICFSSRHSHVITSAKNKKRFYHSRISKPTIWFFFKKKWYNMIVAKKNSKFYYYFNLASPFIYEEETIKYIDFDLDFRINDARIDRMTELDINEFNENKILYKYPQKLIDKIKQAETEIKERFKNGDFKKYLDMDLLYLVK